MYRQGKYMYFVKFSTLLVLLLLVCTPCFLKKEFKTQWGITVVDGKINTLGQVCVLDIEKKSLCKIYKTKKQIQSEYTTAFTSKVDVSSIASFFYLHFKIKTQPTLYLLLCQFRI